MLMPMLGMATMVMLAHGDGVDITDHGDMAIGDAKRDQLTMKRLLLGPVLMLMPMLGMATMVMLAHGDGVDITDHGDMAIGDAKRGQLTRRPLLDPMLMLMLMLIMATGEVIEDGGGGYYRPWGYGYWGRKKRSTDETPESGPNADASADADAWYGYYGYARPWGWGGYYRPWGYGYWGRK